MVFFAPLISAATLFAGFAAAAPRPDSALGSEVGVSAPNGVILSDTAELASNLATASSAASSSSVYYPATATSSYQSVATAYSSASSAAYYSSASSSSAYSSSAYYTTTSTAYGSAMTYGSGGMNWGGNNYNDCVNQCVASFGAPPPTWTPPPSSSSSDDSATHTIVVAPTPGVLRYMPPFVNAKPGEKIHWVWNAPNHTVTRSSQLQMCNKTSDTPFASGEQNTGFTFDQVVNDTKPIFFYCGTPNHCQNGMFGTINPGNSDGSVTVDSMMPSMVSNSSTLSAMMSYLNNLNGSAAAMSWGGSVSMSNFPDWSHSYVMENVLYARAFFAMNPDTISADGKVDMSAGGNPIKFPQDLSAVMRVNNAASGSPTADSASSTASDASSTAAASSPTSSSSGAPQATNTNGAGHVVASSAVIGIAAIAASLLAL